MHYGLCLVVLFVAFHVTGGSRRPWYRKNGQRISLGNGQTLTYNEQWGYVDVREGAHMFWWLYANANTDENRPLILWLQGGPGASGAGFGNFDEIGPLTQELTARNTTWLQEADLIFVDNPVGTGFSYVDSDEKYTRNVEQISQDLLTLFTGFFMKLHPEYQTRPFYIFCESYGGKMTPHFAMVLHQAIQKGTVKANLQGIGIGDGWVSGIDYVETWGPYLYALSMLDPQGYNQTQQLAARCRRLVDAGDWIQSEECWNDMESLIMGLTDDVSWYNVLKRGDSDPWSSTRQPNNIYDQLYQRHANFSFGGNLAQLMNGQIKRKLKIIPVNVSWGGQSANVFQMQGGDFMKPVIYSVDYLLANSTVKVAIYSGQLDLICCTLGTAQWMKKMEWPQLEQFNTATRTSFHLPNNYQTAGFEKIHGKLSFYWLMRGGHMVAHDSADATLMMVKKIIAQ